MSWERECLVTHHWTIFQTNFSTLKNHTIGSNVIDYLMKLHACLKKKFFSVTRGNVFNYLANEPWLKLCDIILNWDGIYYINERVDSLLCNYWWPELVYRVIVLIFGTVLFMDEFERIRQFSHWDALRNIFCFLFFLCSF